MSEANLPPLAQSHFEDPYHQGTCEDATHSGEIDCPDIGRLCLDLIVDDEGLITEAWFDGEGSPWLLGAASIFAESIEGCLLDEVRTWCNDEYLSRFKVTLEGAFQTAWLAPLQLLKFQLGNAEELDVDDDENEGGSHFYGPHLGEEC